MADALIEDVLGSYEEKSLAELQGFIARIDSEIHANVTKHHNDLLVQTSNVELMDDVVVNTLSRTRTCLANVRKTGDSLDELYSKLYQAVAKQEKLYEAREKIEIFEKVLKYNWLIEGEQNLADVAMYVENIETLCAISNLDKLKPYREKANSLSLNIEKQTENMMIQGMIAGSYTQVASALQILVNLNKLSPKVEKVLNETEKQLERDIKLSLSLKKGHDKTSSGGASQPGRASISSKLSNDVKKQVWGNLEALVTKLVTQTSKIKFLSHVMKTAKDLNSNFSFYDFVEENLWTKFWNGFMEALVQNLGSTDHEGIQTLFEDNFPKLLSIVTNMGVQVEDCSGLNTTVRLSSGLRGVTLNYEKAFLSKSLAKLFDAVNHIFAKTPATCPTQSEIDLLVGLINKEMNLEDAMLKKLVARNITKTIQLVCVRAEQLICNDGNATQVIGPATDSQISNGRLVNILNYFKSKLKPENHEPIVMLMESILNPLVQAISETIEAILLTMHQENFKRTSKTTEYSLYMGELSSFLQRVAKDYLGLYNSNEITQKSSHQISLRAIKSMVTNITLVADLNGETRKQLMLDLNHVEVALMPICPVTHDGLRFLRAFKSLLRMDVKEIKESNIIGSLIPHSCVLHLIINQTNGQIRPPHTVNNWSIPRYLRWLEDHSEEEKLVLLKSSVEAYVQTVSAKGQAKFHPFYPIILDIIKRSYSD